MTFVPELSASLLFGGAFNDPSFNQTWIYAADRNNWTRLDTGAKTPPGRIHAAVAYAAKPRCFREAEPLDLMKTYTSGV